MVAFLNHEVIFGALLCLCLSIVAIRWLAPKGWLDFPCARKLHRTPTPVTGGLALWVALALGQLAGWIHLPLRPHEWAAVHVMALMGALDDRFDLRARIKASVGFGVALLLGWYIAEHLALNGGRVPLVGMEIPNRMFITFPLAVLWFWGIPQAYNLIDGINGLALGLSLLLLNSLGWGIGSGAAFLWGAIIVSLLLNYPRARHFMGDSGAFLLGTLLAILALKRGLPSNPNLALWAFAYPIVDVTLVVLIRLAQHRPLGQADHHHLHHWAALQMEKWFWGHPSLAPIFLLLLAMGPMLHLPPYHLSHGYSVAGLILLLGMASLQFRGQVKTRAVVPPPSPVKPPVVHPGTSHMPVEGL